MIGLLPVDRIEQFAGCLASTWMVESTASEGPQCWVVVMFSLQLPSQSLIANPLSRP